MISRKQIYHHSRNPIKCKRRLTFQNCLDFSQCHYNFIPCCYEKPFAIRRAQPCSCANSETGGIKFGNTIHMAIDYPTALKYTWAFYASSSSEIIISVVCSIIISSCPWSFSKEISFRNHYAVHPLEKEKKVCHRQNKRFYRCYNTSECNLHMWQASIEWMLF